MNISNAVFEKFDALRREAMESLKTVADRESLFNLIKNRYHEILRIAVEEYDKQNSKPESIDECPESEDGDEHQCPHCGAADKYSTDRLWLGTSESEPCRVCGADIQNCHPTYYLQGPIEDWDLVDLLDELRAVQDVYDSKPMTYEEAGRNREYFQRLSSVLAHGKAVVGGGRKPKSDLFNTRIEVEQWEEDKRNYEQLYEYAFDLIGEIDGGKVAKYLYGHEGLGVDGIAELRQLVAELELEKKAKAVLT